MPRKPDLTKKERYNDPFPSRLRELQEERHVTQEQLKVVLNLANRQSVTGYVDGETLPTIDKLVAVANYFDVTPNYLLGLSDAATNDIEMQEICDYTGLSVEAINAIREVNFAFGNDELFQDVSNNFFSLFWREFVSDLAELIHEIDYVSFVLETKQDYSIGASVETITNLKRELQIALFSFSERCRCISDLFGGRETLDRIQHKERFLNSLILEREAADDGQHIEASDN